MIVHRTGIVLARPVPGTPPSPRIPLPHRQVLESGLRLLAAPHATFPQIAIRLILPAGGAADPAGLEGLAALTGAMLTEGTDALPAEELNRRLDRLGAAVSVQVGSDFAEIDMLLLRETLDEGLVLLAEIAARPRFPEQELARLRRETVDALEARLDEPANVADDALGEALYPAGHPYGRLPLGTIGSVERVEREHLQNFHREHYGARGAILIAAGDLDASRFAALVEERLASWRGQSVSPPYPPDPPPVVRGVPPAAIKLPWEEAHQAELRVGGAGMRRDSPDWIPAAVANYLLGGSTITGRLGANLREERGWTYGVRSGFSATLQRGGWGIDTAVDTEVAQPALREIRRELTRFLAEPVPDEELARGRDALILSLPRAFETPARLVSRLATLEMFGLDEDYWQRFPERVRVVDRDEVLRVAHAYFDPAGLHTVQVGG